MHAETCLKQWNNINIAATGVFYFFTAVYVYMYITYGAYFFPMNE
jgi:hypothetical protein